MLLIRAGPAGLFGACAMAAVALLEEMDFSKAPAPLKKSTWITVNNIENEKKLAGDPTLIHIVHYLYFQFTMEFVGLKNGISYRVVVKCDDPEGAYNFDPYGGWDAWEAERLEALYMM
jgi:hypothetical protein